MTCVQSWRNHYCMLPGLLVSQQPASLSLNKLVSHLLARKYGFVIPVKVHLTFVFNSPLELLFLLLPPMVVQDLLHIFHYHLLTVSRKKIRGSEHIMSCGLYNNSINDYLCSNFNGVQWYITISYMPSNTTGIEYRIF